MTQIIWMFLISLAVTTLASNLQVNPSYCGRKYGGVNTMIIGGKPANEYAWPWQVAMFKDKGFLCGGSLIDPTWVLTAAHCVEISSECRPGSYTFKVGSTSLTGTTSVSQERQAIEIIIHAGYKAQNGLDNDIALIKMNKPFSLYTNNEVNTICLPTKSMENQFKVGQDAYVTGWGELKYNGDYPDKLQQAVVPLYDQKKCRDSYPEGEVTSNMICAGYKRGGADACRGDSGGPLVAYPTGSTRLYQIGIVSFGALDCGSRNSPGVYTRVTRYEQWIKSALNNPTDKTLYVVCGCEHGTQSMSTTAISAISVLSVLLAIQSL